jgi:DNA-binding PadR family transcriptional regulator
MKWVAPRTIDVLKELAKRDSDRRGVADILKLQRETISSIFTRLEHAKLIERIQPEDKTLRQKLIFRITAAGRATLAAGATGKSKPLKTTSHGGVYAKAQSTPNDWRDNPRNVMNRQTYVPPKVMSPRPDSDQHLSIESKGQKT